MSNSQAPSRRRAMRAVLIGMGAVAVIAVVAPACALGPPAPSGELSVGHTFFTLEDPQRLEPMTDDPEDHRWIGVHAWYPATVDEDHELSRPVYVDAPTAEQLERHQGIPSWIPVGSDAYAWEDAPALAGTYPVLIFNHGYASFATQNSVFAEHLASHGYVVLAIEHPYESLYAHDGRGGGVAAELDAYRALPEAHHGTDLAGYLMAVNQRAAALRTTREDAAAYSAALHAFVAEDPVLASMEGSFDVWVADTRQLVEALPAIAAGDVAAAARVAGTLDVARLGIFGHSFGGAVATEMNVKAGLPAGTTLATVNYDAAGMYWAAGEAGQPRVLTAPALFMTATHSAVSGDAVFDTTGVNDGYVLHSAASAWAFTLEGAGHQNFTDLSWVPGASLMGLVGPGDGPAIGDVVVDHTRRFFDASLKDGRAYAASPGGVLREVVSQGGAEPL